MDECEDFSGKQYESISSFHNAKFNVAGMTRVITSIFLLCVYYRSKRNAINSLNNGYYTKTLILPSYFQYIIAIMCSNLVFGITSMLVDRTSRMSPLMASEVGVSRLFTEGLAFFLMQYGAGQYAIRKSFLLALLWGASTAILYYFILEFHGHDRFSKAYVMYFTHTSAIVCFYAVMLFAPIKHVYRRPALKTFATYQIVENTSWICITTLLYVDVQFGFCMQMVANTVMQGLLQSLFMYYALMEDSNYWQGIGNSSPLAGMWEIAADTAEGISDGLSCLSSSIKSLPLIHFGSISLHQHVGFVAGGTSRVYFGKWGKNEVALKILFTMELTPDVVAEFYTEVQILNTLQHRNVVKCLGISVMPPSISLVMEHCMHGSLFDYLYKVKQSKRTHSRTESNSSAHRIYSLFNELRSRMSSYTSSRSSTTTAQVAKTSMSVVVKSPLAGLGGITESDSNGLDLRDSGYGKGSDYNSNRNSNMSITSDDEFGDIESYLGNGGHNRASNNSRQSQSSIQSDKDNRESFRLSLNQTRKKRGLSMNQRMREKLTTRNLSARTDTATTAANAAAAAAAATAVKKPTNTTAAYNTGGSVSNSAHFATSEKPSFSYKEKLRMMHDVVSGILFLHEQGYMHCDIKSPNFLVANDRTVKVADLGEARELYGQCEPEDLPNPALNWAPPEMLTPVLADRTYTMFSDVYGVAMVLSEILLQVVPLDESKIKLQESAVYEKLVDDNLRPVLPDSIPEALIQVVQQAWCTNPSDRVSCEQLLMAIEKHILTA